MDQTNIYPSAWWLSCAKFNFFISIFLFVENKKSQLRESFKLLRSQLSQDDVIKRSIAINKNFIENLLPKIYQKNYKKIFSLYVASGNEVKTDLIAEHFKKNEISFSYPKIIKKDHHLDFILNDEKLVNQGFVASCIYPKIYELNDGKKVFPDILIIPLLAFDSNLARLGMGGGFYDRTIEFLKIKHNIITIGLAYNFQLCDSLLATSKHDQSLDFIASEDYIISAKRA